MKKYFLSLLLLASGFHAGFSCANTFDPVTNILTMGSVTVRGQQFDNVVVRIDQFAVLGAGNSYPVEDGILEICQAENLTTDRFGSIQVGMSVDQVMQIIGCESNNEEPYYSTGGEFVIWWSVVEGVPLTPTRKFRTISVFFDVIDSSVNGKRAEELSSPAAAKNSVTTFDPATKVLAIDSVWVTGGLRHENVALSVENFTLLAVGGSPIKTPPPVTPDPVSPPPPPPPPPVTGVSVTCTLDNFTKDKFDAIQAGMSIDQVNQVIGCKFEPRATMRLNELTQYTWVHLTTGRHLISVLFDESTLKVTGTMGTLFKNSMGF